VVAASAAAGYICSPTRFEQVKPRYTVTVHEVAAPPAAVEIVEGFPQTMTGRALLLPVDNLNTDGIYSGKLTYRDDVPPEEMAAASFANYDPEFNRIARAGDIVVAGRNFGTGSSREQAATCLAHRGIACVVASSFSQTYARNAFNNGFLVIESPALYQALHRTLAGTGAATIPGPQISIDFRTSRITAGRESWPFQPVSPVAQELIAAGGAENVVRQRLRRSERVESRK
jgi:homoaconitate hydratase